MAAPWVDTTARIDPDKGGLHMCMVCSRCGTAISGRPSYQMLNAEQVWQGVCWRCYIAAGPRQKLRAILQGCRMGAASHRVAPGYGGCLRCHTSWGIVEGHSTTLYMHSTYYGGVVGCQGCFPLCEACWRDLSPAERLPYYQQLYACWQRDGVGDDVPFWKWEIAVLHEGDGQRVADLIRAREQRDADRLLREVAP